MSRARDLADLGGSADAGTVTGESLIINGDMAVDQRNQTTTSSGYTVDRWNYAAVNYDELVVAITQDTDAPSGSGFVNSLKIDVTTEETTLDANEVGYFAQKIESQNLTHLNFGSSSAKSITLSFWVKSSLTGKYSLTLWRPNDNRSNTLSYTIDSANTWEYKTLTYDGDTGGSNFLDDNTAGLWLFFMLSAGTDWSGTPHTGWGTYTATDDLAHSDMVDFFAQTGTFYITGVKLEVGTTATPFKHESYGDNLEKCQRYYQRFTHSTSSNGLCNGTSYTNLAHYFVFHHPTRMRTRASIGYSALSDLRLYTQSTGVTPTTVAFQGGTDGTTEFYCNTSAIGSGGNSIWIRLYTSNAVFDFSAEL